MKIRPLYDRIVMMQISRNESTRDALVIPNFPQQGEVMVVGTGKRPTRMWSTCM
jgi:co-chaperonin GroES (HSP10)